MLLARLALDDPKVEQVDESACSTLYPHLSILSVLFLRGLASRLGL